jgi:hypothetical protein
VINLEDDNEIAKIDEEAHNELNLFFYSSMSLNDNDCDDHTKEFSTWCLSYFG